MQFHFIPSIAQVPAKHWNALTQTGCPFVRHEFLHALETSGTVSQNTGWQPQHLLGFRDGELCLALPMYIKSHSYGEYVFDWAWANAWQRAGLPYYPKLLSAIPFTPCTGPRLLLAGGESPALAWPQVLNAVQQHATVLQASGWHCLFTDTTNAQALADAGAPQRLGCQFHWHNRHYRNFDDFLAGLASRKRKNILKERRKVLEQGFEFRVRHGMSLSEADWRFFYQLYQNTYFKRSGHEGYLNLAFFLALGRDMPHNCVIIQAEKDGRALAASLFLRDSHTLYGRYWGSLAEFDFLHFETCYYQGIDYAIAEGLTRFDGGAQGEHKIARGFEPVITHSNHWVTEPGFREPLANFLAQEATQVQQYAAECRDSLPYAQRTQDVTNQDPQNI